MPAYSVDRLRFSYGHARGGASASGLVLNDLTFDVRPGEILGVLGPNGSGKSSLLKILAKVLRPQDGSVTLFGAELADMRQQDVARVVALVPQESPITFPFSITEMVLMGRFPHHCRHVGLSGLGWEGPEDMRVAEEAMRETDVRHLAHRSIADVSGGERQRAVIARALTQEPKVLLLDEPTAFLDLHHQLDICSILRRLNEEKGLTVVLVSHDLNLASQYCDRLLLLDRGRIVRLGPPDEVIRPEVLEEVYRCRVLVDRHPQSGLPRVTLPGRSQATGHQSRAES
ncbi:MAG: ABC transporter ATP-binding protein [Nitrospiraceae bacterium]